MFRALVPWSLRNLLDSASWSFSLLLTELTWFVKHRTGAMAFMAAELHGGGGGGQGTWCLVQSVWYCGSGALSKA